MAFFSSWRRFMCLIKMHATRSLSQTEKSSNISYAQVRGAADRNVAKEDNFLAR